MSDNKDDRNRQYIGKIKNQQTQYGIMQKIYLDNQTPVNADGTPNKYFKGVLVFVSATGEQFQVNQMNITIPKDGMSPANIQKGFVAQVSVDIGDEKYSVKKLG